MTREAKLRKARAIADSVPEWKRNKRERYVLITYNLLPNEYRALIDSQHNRCAICDSPPRSPHTYLMVDHCHTTNVVRELLCHGCNFALGMIKENPETARSMAKYIEKHSPK